MKTIKSILFENDGLTSGMLIDWVKSIDENYKEVNSSTRNYDRSDDLYFFAMLIEPNLENIITSSGFPNPAYGYALSIGKKRDAALDYPQISYFMWLIREAALYRQRKELKPLTLHVDYAGENLLSDLKNNRKWEDAKDYLKLTLRQCKEFTLKIYKDYKLIQAIKTEEELKFD